MHTLASRLRLTRDGRLGLLLVLPVILIMGGLVFFPLIASLIESFFRVEPMKPGSPFVGIKNYVTVMTDRTVLAAWGTTAVYVILAVVIETGGGSPSFCRHSATSDTISRNTARSLGTALASTVTPR